MRILREQLFPEPEIEIPEPQGGRTIRWLVDPDPVSQYKQSQTIFSDISSGRNILCSLFRTTITFTQLIKN